MSNNWLPKEWPEAVRDREVFTHAGIRGTYVTALNSWDVWNRSQTRNQQVTNTMEQSLRLYLEQAASVKKLVNSQMWNFCGLRWSLARLEVAIYYALVTLIFVFKVAMSFVEDFPGGVGKPGEVWWVDLGSAIADLIFVICLSFQPEICQIWHAGTGLTGFGSKVGRAYMIAAYTTPLTPISTHRDRFNAFAPAIVTGMKSVLALMALPSEKLPLSRAGEPFAPLANCGEGLSNADRCKLLGAILSCPYRAVNP